MSVTAVVGANWGDEGKGKTIDYLAKDADFVVRFQGGNNAGHTIINDFGKFALHLIPSGVFYPDVINILGPGVAINISAFLNELDNLKNQGVPKPEIKISDRAQVLLPFHILFDELEEERLAGERYGSTKSGIAPFYSDKYLKVGLQINEIFDNDRVIARLKRSIPIKNALLKRLYNHRPLKIDDIVSTVQGYRDKIRPFIADTTQMLAEAVRQDKNILLEGQLGALRDPDHGIYPYPTSSSPLAGFATVGAGIPPYKIDRIVAVVKSYSSCVGAGPFVTELFGEEGDTLRERGGSAGEYGATTGRPRRVGWFDCVATAYGCLIQGATEVALTNLDVLGYLDSIRVCTDYEIEGKGTDLFPVTRDLDKAKPRYKELKGWKKDISGVRSFDTLPPEAKRYVRFIEDRIKTPIRWISNGPERDQMIKI